MEKLRIAEHETGQIDYGFKILKHDGKDYVTRIAIEDMEMDKRKEFEKLEEQYKLDIVKTLLDIKGVKVKF